MLRAAELATAGAGVLDDKETLALLNVEPGIALVGLELSADYERDQGVPAT